MTADASPRRFQAIPGLAGAWLPVGVVALLQVQIIIPVTAVGLKICPADPLALLAAMFLVVGVWQSGGQPPWRLRGLPAWLLALTLVLMAGLAVGYLELGRLTSWALVSKFVGWFILVAYLAAGLWVGAALGEDGRRLLTLWLVRLTAAAVAVALVPHFAWSLGFSGGEWTSAPFSGFLGNRNAFAFFVTVAAVAVLADGARERPLFGGERTVAVLLGVLMLGITVSASRAGLGALAAVILAALALRCVALRPLLAAGLAVAVCWLALSQRDLVMQYLDLAAPAERAAPPVFAMSSGLSNAERLMSFERGLALWLERPILGIGLGSFVATQPGIDGEPLTIHNTALWLLVETGIVGMAAFAGFAWAAVRALLPLVGGDGEDRAVRLTGLLTLLAFAVMSLAHEMMYQRILWLVLGMALASPRWGGRRLPG